jgi:hypothetical protein
VTIALADLIIEAGGVTILFAISLTLAEEVVEAIRRKPRWVEECDEHQTACLASALQRKWGSVHGSSRCLACRDKCNEADGWPQEIKLGEKLVSCVYGPN